MDKIDLIYQITQRSMDKIDLLETNVNNIKTNTDRNTNNLEEHMRRTMASEKRIKVIESRFTIGWLLKIITSSVVTLGAIAAATSKLLGYI